MAMFEKVTDHVVASAGPKTLHPVADINSAERHKTLCIIQRKKSFWFWKRPSMVPTFVTLSDLLIKDDDIAAKEEKFTLMKKFEDDPKLNLSGSVEVAASLAKKIAAQANIKLGGQDKVELDIKLGDIIKCEIPFEDLREALESNAIDVTHPLYVGAAKQSPKTSLCIVVEDLATKEDGSVKGDGDWRVEVEAGASAGPNCVQLNVKAAGSVESSYTRSYTIPPGTPLAYGCIEISVDPSGKVTLHDTEDTLDQSIAALQLPDDPFVKIKQDLDPLIRCKDFQKLQEEIGVLLSNASEADFRVIHILLYYANASSSMSFATLEHLLGVDITSNWKNFITHFGFSIVEDPNMGTVVKFPIQMEAGLHKASLALIDSILDCHENSWNALQNISHDHALVIMKIFQKEFKRQGNSLSNNEVSSMLTHDPSTMDFLDNSGFKKSPDGMLTFTGKNTYQLLDVYAIMYFLSAGQKHCSIL